LEWGCVGVGKMSYRDVRHLVHTMRRLGYPGLISLQGFKEPNFVLVAEVLFWLVKKFDPNCDASDDIATEVDRVIFLKSMALTMMQKMRIKLNLKRLYAAQDGAVKELLALAEWLDKAVMAAREEREGGEGAGLGGGEVDEEVSLRNVDLKRLRTLVGEVTSSGAKLHELLEGEKEFEAQRTAVLNRQMDMEEVERVIRTSMGRVKEDTERAEEELVNLERDERSLETKIEKRKAELERNQKRLATLQGVRPAYMDEYERLQTQLQNMYVVYLERFRNLEFLEAEMEKHNRAEMEKIEENQRNMKRMQKKIHEEELRILKGEGQYGMARGVSGSDEDEGSSSGSESSGSSESSESGSGSDSDDGGARGGGRAQARGNDAGLLGPIDESDEESSSESDASASD